MSPPIFPPYDGDSAHENLEEKARAKRVVQAVIDRFLYIAKHDNIEGFDAAVMNGLRLLDASGHPGDPKANPPIAPSAHPTVLFELDVTKAYINLNRVMHGGAAATIFDMTTMLCLAPVQRPGYWEFMGGVSRSINMSYLKAVPIGITVRLRCWAMQHGRTTALIRGQMESMDGKTVYVACEQHKINVPSLPEHIKIGELMAELQLKKDKESAKL